MTEEEYLQSIGMQGGYQPQAPPNWRERIAAVVPSLQQPPNYRGFEGANLLHGLAQGFAGATNLAQQRQDEIRRTQNAERLSASHGYRAAVLKKLMEPTVDEEAKKAGAIEAARLRVKNQFDEENTQLFPLPGPVQEAMQRAQGIGPLERKQAMVPADKLQEVSRTYRPQDYNATMQAAAPSAEHDAGIEAMVDRAAITGEFPAMGMGGTALRMKGFARLAEKYPGIDLGKTKANYAAHSKALQDMVQAQSGVEAFSETMIANYQTMIDQVAEKDPLTGKWKYKIPNTAPIWNKPVRDLAKQLGDARVAKFTAAREIVAQEAARVLASGKLGAAQISDTAREEMRAVVDGSYNLKQLVGVYRVLQSDVANRKKSFVDQIRHLNSMMVPIDSTGAPMKISQSPVGAAAGRSSAAGGMVRVRDKDGHLLDIDPADLDEALQDGAVQQ